jgi:hypothetical protein
VQGGADFLENCLRKVFVLLIDTKWRTGITAIESALSISGKIQQQLATNDRREGKKSNKQKQDCRAMFEILSPYEGATE